MRNRGIVNRQDAKETPSTPGGFYFLFSWALLVFLGVLAAHPSLIRIPHFALRIARWV